MNSRLRGADLDLERVADSARAFTLNESVSDRLRGYLIHTDVVSEYNRAQLPRAGVVKWMDATPEISQYVSVLTLAEIEQGFTQGGRQTPSGLAALPSRSTDGRPMGTPLKKQWDVAAVSSAKWGHACRSDGRGWQTSTGVSPFRFRTGVLPIGFVDSGQEQPLASPAGGESRRLVQVRRSPGCRDRAVP